MYSYDRHYLQYLVDLNTQNDITELPFTSDGHEVLEYGTLPEVLATVNFQYNYDESFTRLQEFQPDRPLMVAEFWAGISQCCLLSKVDTHKKH